MKKTIILLALAIVAGASCTEAIAKGKKKNDAKVAPVKEMVTLASKSDSISYASGQAFTRGLMDYVHQSLNVDSAQVDAFVAGLKEALYAVETPESKAKVAAQQISTMVRDRMLPDLEKQVAGTSVAFSTDLFKRGFIDAVEKDASVFSVEEAAKYQEVEMKAIKEQQIEAMKAEGKAWLAANATKEGVKVLPSGLQYRIIKEGTGPVAEQNDDVSVRYEGKLLDGTVFDSSYTRSPNVTSFKPSQVIKGWTEALCMMPEGSEWELYIPEDLAYGGRATGNIPAYSTLIFKVEVVSVKKPVVVNAEEEAAAQTTEKKPAAKKATAKKRVAKK